MDRLTSVKIKLIDQHGQPYYSDPILLKVDVEQIHWRDTENTLFDILGDVDISTKGSVQEQLTSLQDEVADARIDNLNVEWANLGKSIRGQIDGIKKYLKTSGEIAEMIIPSSYTNKKWVDGDNTPVPAPGYTAIQAHFSNITPTKIYIRTRWYEDDSSGVCGSYWCFGPNAVTTTGSTLINNDFKTISLANGITTVRFNCATDFLTSAIVTCSNRTYELRESERANTTNVVNKLIRDFSSQTLLGTLTIGSGTDPISIEIPNLAQNDIIRINGEIHDSNPTAIYIGTNDFKVCKQTLYTMIGDEKPNINTYAVVNATGAQGNYIHLSYESTDVTNPASGTVNIYKMTLDNKRTVQEGDSGMKWINGETIYRKIYKGRCRVKQDDAQTRSVILDSTWNYKWTIINSEINISRQHNKRGRDQMINGSNTNPNNAYIGSLFVADVKTEDVYKRVTDTCDLKFVPSSLVDLSTLTESIYFYYNITVYYIKNSYTIFPTIEDYNQNGGLWGDEPQGIKITLPHYHTESGQQVDGDVYHPFWSKTATKFNSVTLYLNESKVECWGWNEQTQQYEKRVTPFDDGRIIPSTISVQLQALSQPLGTTGCEILDQVEITLDERISNNYWKNGITFNITNQEALAASNFYLLIQARNDTLGKYKVVIYLDAIEFNNII